MVMSKDPWEEVKRQSDELWGKIATLTADVDRIARNGPDGSDRDKNIVQMVFNTVVGDLLYRNQKEG